MSEQQSSSSASQIAEENYKPAKQETLTDILSKDNEDESLKRYKQQLLGAVLSHFFFVNLCCGNCCK